MSIKQATEFLDNNNTKSVILEGELSWAEMHVNTGKNYGKLQ